MDFSTFSKEEPTLPSDSDSDEDYIPSAADSDPPSEIESSEKEQPSSSDEESETPNKRKRPQRSTKRRARKKNRRSQEEESKNSAEEDKTESEEKNVEIEEEEKKRADSLWADFQKDTGSNSQKSVPKSSHTNGSVEVKETKKEPEKKVEKENKVKITKVFEFAGEQVKVVKEVNADSAEASQASLSPSGRGAGAASSPGSSASRGRGRGRTAGGLSSMLGQLGKKQKLGTLEKSKLDWDQFKQNEGIEDELKNFNRGKDGYLEKQDFLQRADVRQFEIEKSFRASKRSSR